MVKPIIIGTRGSPLALQQAESVRDQLIAAHSELDAELVTLKIIKTTGDRILDRHLMLAGGKGLFTKEIEDALLSGEIDCAVHSCKDMPTRLPDGLELSAFLKREDPRDAFISHDVASFDELAHGATLGTASLRRRAQALKHRPDLKIVTFRGNVQTRLKKLEAGEAVATFLAQAGLNRLNMESVARETLDIDQFLPAPAQGIVTVESCVGDKRIKEYLQPLHSRASEIAAFAERGFLSSVDGSCRTPIAAFATVQGDELRLRAQLLSVDGRQEFKGEITGPLEDAWSIGQKLGRQLKAEAGSAFFEQMARDAEKLVS